MTSLSDLVTEYIQRVVNTRDLAAVDELVAPQYRGTGPGWPATIDELRRFYRAQMQERPDWHIDVQETIELGDSVVVRAHAFGTVIDGNSRSSAGVDWLTHYRVVNGRITEINLLTLTRTGS